MLFECGQVGKVPSDAVQSTKSDAEESEDDQPGVLVTLRAWCVEGRHVFGTATVLEVVMPKTAVKIKKTSRRNRRVKKGRSKMVVASKKRNRAGRRKSQPMKKPERDS